MSNQQPAGSLQANDEGSELFAWLDHHRVCTLQLILGPFCILTIQSLEDKFIPVLCYDVFDEYGLQQLPSFASNKRGPHFVCPTVAGNPVPAGATLPYDAILCTLG